MIRTLCTRTAPSVSERGREAVPCKDWRRVGAKDFSLAPLTEPDMRARIRLFGLIDQSASVSWADTCGWLISAHKAVSEAIRPVNQAGG